MAKDDIEYEFTGEKKPTKRRTLQPRDISESWGKLPPQAVEMEQTVLGAALLESYQRVSMLDKLTEDDFYIEKHREVFVAIKTLSDQGVIAEMRTVANELRRTGKLEIIGGPFFLAELTAGVSGNISMDHYCLVIMEKRMKRDMIEEASTIHQEAYEDSEDVFKILDRFANFAKRIYDKLPSNSERSVREGLIELIHKIKDRKDDNSEIVGLASGYPTIDKVLRGLKPGNLIILAARPSMGKTTILMNMLYAIAVSFKQPVGLFSLEQTFDELIQKFATMATDISSRKMIGQKFDDSDWERMVNNTSELAKSEIWIDQTSALTINQFRARARRMKEKYNVQIIGVDYLQLMRDPDNRHNREREISEISACLKNTAKELGIPIIALSQLSRKVEERKSDNFIPMLADLRESGAIEQDADVVMFAYRPAYYKITGDAGGTFITGLSKLIIAKHRGGPLGEAMLQLIGDTSKLVNLDSPYEVYTKPIVADKPAQMSVFSQEPSAEELEIIAQLENSNRKKDEDVPF